MDPLCEHILPPRVYGEFGSEPLLDVLQELLDGDGACVVDLAGPGCTTALNFVKAWADEHYLSVSTADGWLPQGNQDKHTKVRLKTRCPGPAQVTLHLSGWERDDHIEYLLKFHPTECKRVMANLSSVDPSFAEGSPYIWQPYLEWLATHDSAIHPTQFVRDVLATEFDSAALARLADQWLTPSLVFTDLASCASPQVSRWLRLSDVQRELKAHRLAEHICQCNHIMLRPPWEAELLNRTAEKLSAVRDQPAWQIVLDFLQRAARKKNYSSAAVALLARMAPDWVPHMRRSIDLSLAELQGVRWAGCFLRKAVLTGANLSDSVLSDANLNFTLAIQTRCHRAVMRCAQLERVRARKAEFNDADLEEANLADSRFYQCVLSGARLVRSLCLSAYFVQTDMRSVQMQQANCDRCVFEDVNLEGAALDAARLTCAYLERVNFKNASLCGADFTQAEFAKESNLELLDLSNCIFEGAILKAIYLTDSVARNADFRFADLRQAGLAGVVWENCSLRGADLRGAAFHMGSTRCGLVDSPYPSHGTRTGFYTDDYVDLTYKHPEQVRKAALIGCDLRGALIEGCDFYLVDVRDCQLDPHQRELMAASGAILE